MQFSYKARNKTGSIIDGVLDAPDRFAVARELRSRNELPISVTPIIENTNIISQSSFNQYFSHVSLREKIVFVNNLAGMLSAGLPLYRALDVEYKQNTNPYFKTIINGLMISVNQGEEFSLGLKKYPTVFSPLFSAMVHAGEESGKLSQSLKEIGSNLEKSHNLTSKIKGALTYPAIIVVAIFIVAILMLMFVIPTLTKIFTDLKTPLPPATQFVVSISNGVSEHPLIFLCSLFVFIGLVTLFIRSPKTQRFNDSILLHLPIVGPIVKEVNIARTARTLSSLLSSGIEMTKSLDITRDVLQNLYYKDVLNKASEAVQKGETLSSVFKKELRLYPVMVGEMLTVGEETGSLTNMLIDVANYYEEEVDNKTKSLSTIIEPAIMLLVGAAVGFFAVSMISPMYSLLNSIQ